MLPTGAPSLTGHYWRCHCLVDVLGTPSPSVQNGEQCLVFFWCLHTRISACTSCQAHSQTISDAIRSDDPDDQRFLPVLDPYRPVGSTNGVFFQTSLHCVKTIRSHISHIACHAKVWERDLAVQLERHPAVLSYVRNYRLDYSIPYQWGGQTHQYVPDFIVRIRQRDGSLLHLVLEVKGMEDNIDRIKASATRKWVDAVNNWGKLGDWDYDLVRDLTKSEEVIDRYASAEIN